MMREEKIKGALKPLLAFAGAHCRLSNLTGEHTVIETEKYQVNGQDVQHIAGQKHQHMVSLW